MNRFRWLLTGFVVLVSLCAYLLLRAASRPTSEAMEPPSDATERAIRPQVLQAKLPNSVQNKPPRPSSREPEIPPAIETQEDFHNRLDATDMMSSYSLMILTQQFRTQDRERIATFFTNELKAIDPSNITARSRLLLAADNLQGNELFPLWEDLLLRKTPLYDSEALLLRESEPSLDGKNLRGEMLAAIRNLGIIALEDDRAVARLEDIASHPDKALRTDFIREEAFSALKDANRAAALRVLKVLPENDSLRIALKQRFANP